MWERFSFYGMRALLARDHAAVRRGQFSKRWHVDLRYLRHVIYLMALPGGWVADRFIGYRRAVVVGVILAIGHLLLAFSPLPFFCRTDLHHFGDGTAENKLHDHGGNAVSSATNAATVAIPFIIWASI